MQRRHFLKLSATGTAAVIFGRLTYAAGTSALVQLPDEAWASIDDKWVKMTRTGNTFSYYDVEAEIRPVQGVSGVYVRSPASALTGIKFKWKHTVKSSAKTLGDHWERSYGDLAWKTLDADRKHPWYLVIHDGASTAAFGVRTGCNTICWWNIDEDHLSLTFDTHSGGSAVKLGNRVLHAADIVALDSRPGESAYATHTRFCRLMCPKPRLPKQPVYGINDWYVMYGNNSFASVSQQTAIMSQYVSNVNNKAFSVIDDGWQQPDDFSLVNDKFKDMHKMADEIKNHHMRPGLWTRPLIARKDDAQALLAPKIAGRDQKDELILDPTIPENIERIKRNMRLYKQWGFDMVKHDYTSWDIFGRWGMQMKDSFTAPGWAFHDNTRTNAEIINDLYNAIRISAGGMYIIGCNTMSHLSAGVFELNRIGDDTSGREWARTKKMGVNTLGFRLPQHNTFYAADGDCVGLTKDVPWEKNRQWLQLLAESGSPLFVSAQTDILDADKKAAIKLAFEQAAKVQPTGEPLDWLTEQWPSKWKLNNRVVTFNWD